MDHWKDLFYFNSTFMAHLNSLHESCGYAAYLEKYLTFPPPKVIYPDLDYTEACDVQDLIYAEAFYINPCFDPYHITDFCPYLYDPLGDASGYGYDAPGSTIYFNRSDVQAAIHAPPTDWSECTTENVFPKGVDGFDNSDYPANAGVLERVIEKTDNFIIGNGQLDFLIPANGTLLVVQNMTWNGAQGFEKPPTQELFVPYHFDTNEGQLSGAGIMGAWGTERGLTFVTVGLAGHQVPEYQPGVAYRMMEFMLGRIKDLSQEGGFTTPV